MRRAAGTDSESRSFRLQFEASVDQLRADFQQRLHIQVKSATMAAKYIAGLPDKGVGLGVYIPGFQTFADDVLAVTDASVASWLTLVLDEERPAFELRAQEAASRIDPTGAFLREVQTRGIGQRSNASAAGGINNFVRRDQAPFYVTACVRALWKLQYACALTQAPYSLRFCRWANTPRNLTRGEQYYLFDAYSDPLRRVTLDRMMANSQPAMTDLVRARNGYCGLRGLTSTRPSASADGLHLRRPAGHHQSVLGHLRARMDGAR